MRIRDSARDTIHEYWHTTDKARQRDFIVNHVSRKVKGRSTVETNSRRNFTLQYNVTIEDVKHKVCKKIFCGTLGISAKAVRYAVEHYTGHGVATSDRRGCHPPFNKIDEAKLNFIREHIRSFPALESHYSRQSTSKRYLDAQLSVPKMYDLCKKHMETNGLPPENLHKYREVFKQENLSFHKPKRDACRFCVRFENSSDPH